MSKCIICPNHSNWVDPVFLFPVTNNINIMAKSELFKNKFMASLYKAFGIFPIRRGEKDARSLIHAINLFKTEEQTKLLIFPEGHRIKKDIRIEAKIGPAFIAIKAGVPIVPVYMTKNAKIFSKVEIRYGEPIYLDKDKETDKAYLKDISNKLLDTIYNLKLKDN